MLESIRKIAHTTIFKILFGLLIVAFAISGISGLSLGFGDANYIAKVGDRKITMSEIDSRYEQMLRSLGPQAAALPEAQLAQLGLSKDRILQTLVKGALVEEEAKNVGIIVGDKSVIKQLKQTAAFYDEKGEFSTERFNIFLEKMNITEAQLKKDIRNDIQNLILASSVTAAAPKNLPVAEAVAAAIGSKRDIEIIKIPSGKNNVIAEPTAEELNKFYFENSALFTVPETRDISIVKIAKPADEDKSGFDKLTKITDDIAGGANLEEIAKAHTLTIEKIGNVEAGGGKIENATYKLKEKQLSQLTESEDGSYFVIQLDKINESSVPDISTVKDKVLALYKSEKSTTAALKYAQNILVEAKAGKDLLKLAADNQLTYTHAPLFGSNDNSYGEELVMSIYNTPGGDVTGVIPTSDGGYILAKVNKIIPQNITDVQIADTYEKGVDIFRQEIFQQYMVHLEGKHNIKFNMPKEAKQPELKEDKKS